MNIKDERSKFSLVEALGIPSIKISRSRRPSNPSQQVEDVHYDIVSPRDMAKALRTTLNLD